MTAAAPGPHAPRRRGHDVAWAIAGRASTALGAFLIVTLAASALTPRQFGAFLLAISVTTVLGAVARLGLDLAVVRLVADRVTRDDLAGAHGVVGAVSALAAASAVVLLALLAGEPGTWLAGAALRSPDLRTVMPAVALWTAAECLRRTWSEAFRGFDDIRTATLLGEGARALALTGVLVTPALASESVALEEIVWRCALVNTVLGAAAGLTLLSRVRRQAARRSTSRPASGRSRGHARAVLRISLPMLGAGLGGMVVGQGDLWFVGRYLGDSAVASYGAALRLASLLLVPLLVINALLPQRIVRLHVLGDRAGLERLLRTYSGIAAIPSAIGGAVLLLAGGPILDLLFGEFAREATGALSLLVVSQVVAVATGSCGLALLMTGNERAVVVATVASSGILLCGTALVAGNGGSTMAIAAVSAGSTVVLNVWLTLHARQALGVWTHAALPSAALLRGLPGEG